ncbi:MAG: toll/interleukin-1 receptor domain-containing protein, partial [Proteobacteria bacterium]|nr:toll/interleukin-1 receptor domain-containing protein [Pseudomonadota bacterium]
MAQEAIFIGYRRDDSADVAGRIYDQLESKFGEGRLFKDVDSIPPGEHFQSYIARIISQCRIFLAVIGPGWIGAVDDRGSKRLDDPS